MQRIIIAVLALGIAGASTIALYLRWKVEERDAQIVTLERDSAAARLASEQFQAQAVVAKAALDVANEELFRLKAERDAAVRASETAMARRQSP